MEDEIIGFEALYESKCKCQKGKLWKSSVSSFVLNSLEATLNLEKHLKNNTYRAKYHHFRITSPRPRNIISIGFADRIYQRSLNDVVVYPSMTKSFIYDNWACQKDKGTDRALKRFKYFLAQAFKKYGLNFYISQYDIHGYYDNMSHQIVKKQFRRRLDADSYRRCCQVFDSQYGDQDKGFSPGSQMVQIAGISFLDGSDHYCKERLGIKHYERYMDDFLLLHPNLAYHKECKAKIEKKLQELGLMLNPKKSKIFKAGEDILFLGYIFRINKSGKVVILLNSQKVKAERKKLYRMAALVKAGDMTRKTVYDSYRCWRAHASKGDSAKMLRQMDQYLKNLLKG